MSAVHNPFDCPKCKQRLIAYFDCRTREYTELGCPPDGYGTYGDGEASIKICQQRDAPSAEHVS